MPTQFTKTAGTTAMVAAGLWLLVPGGSWAFQEAGSDWDTAVYLLWTLNLLAAGVLTFVASLGLRQRHGTLGKLASVGLVILGIGVVLSFISWALPVWMTIQGVGMLLVTIAIWPKGLAPRMASVAYASGLLIGATLFFVLTFMKVGTPDRWGDYPVAWAISITVGVVIAAAGLIGLGWWLRGEILADVDSADQALTR